MESKTNYTRVGLIVIILLAGLVTAGIWLSVGFDYKKYNNYIVFMHEAVSGLSDDSLVKYNGVKVGFVRKIELSQFDPQQVKLLLEIEEGTPITIDTRATLINQGITGTTYLGLSAESSTLVPLQRQAGEPYPVILYKPSFLNQLEKNINDMTRGFNRIFSKQNTKNLKKSLANLNQFTGVLAKNKANIDKTLGDLPELVSDFKSSLGKFNVMSQDVSAAGKAVSGTMKLSNNTVNKISQQAIPPFVLLMQRLDLIGANLEKVSAQMRQNPAVIIRGSTPIKPGPGE